MGQETNECSERDRAGLCRARKALALEIRKVDVVVGGDLVPFSMGRILHRTTDVPSFSMNRKLSAF